MSNRELASIFLVASLLLGIIALFLLLTRDTSPPPKKDEKSVGDVDFSRVGGTQKTA